MRPWSRSRSLALGAATLLLALTPIAASAASPSPPTFTADPAATTPNVRVTDIRSTFVPSIPDADGDGCSGPYLDLRFTIPNLSATYPVPEELLETQSLPPRPEGFTLLVLQVWTDQFGTGQSMAQSNVPVMMNDVPGQLLLPGQSVEVTWRYRVPNDQTSMRFFGEVTGAHYHVTTGSTGERYRVDVPIPIWDVRPRDAKSVLSAGGADQLVPVSDDGRPTVVSEVYFQNIGASDTPGPVEGKANVMTPESGFVGGWVRPSTSPISAGGAVPVIWWTNVTGDRLPDPKGFMLDTFVQPLCPDGSYGDLSDGNVANNGRTLLQIGQQAPGPRSPTP